MNTNTNTNTFVLTNAIARVSSFIHGIGFSGLVQEKSCAWIIEDYRLVSKNFHFSLFAFTFLGTFWTKNNWIKSYVTQCFGSVSSAAHALHLSCPRYLTLMGLGIFQKGYCLWTLCRCSMYQEVSNLSQLLATGMILGWPNMSSATWAWMKKYHDYEVVHFN